MKIDTCFDDSLLLPIANWKQKMIHICCTGQQVLITMEHYGPLLSVVLRGSFEKSCSQHRVNSFSETFCWWVGFC